MRTAVMAWRNLWRYGRRTAATIAAMALGLAAMIVWTSLSQGFLRDLEAKIVEVEVGDVQVYPAGYRDSPSIFDRIDRERGVTFLFSTHDPRVTDRASRIVRLVDGRVDSEERRHAGA